MVLFVHFRTVLFVSTLFGLFFLADVLLGSEVISSATDSDKTSSPQVDILGFKSVDVEVNGVRIHYSVGGSGKAVVLLHGYAQTSYMWRPIMPLLAMNHTVIVPDLRGAGGS